MKHLGVWLLVMSVAAAALKALDHVPTILTGAPRGVQLYESLEDAERAVGARIWMPGYYPDDLRWPPARVEVVPATPTVVAVRVAGRDGETNRLAIVQTLGAAPPPANLLPRGEQMGTNGLSVGSYPAVLSRLLLGTRELHDLSWVQAGRRITLRYAGPVDRLLLMGRSLARRADESHPH